MFAKLGMPSILSLVFLLGGLLFSANSVSAQATLNSGQAPSPIKTNATWKSSTAAKDALQAEIDGYTQLIDSSNPGNLLQIKMKILVYEAVVANLETGVDVANAAFAGYYKYAPGAHVDNQAVFGMSNNDWSTLYVDMVTALTL